MNKYAYDICIVGGCGHVGLPLALCFANENKRVSIFDINTESINSIRKGYMPFHEEGADDLLHSALASGNLYLTENADVVSESECIIIVLGTPIDEYSNPSYLAISRAVNQCLPYMKNGQLLILRSTVFPGTTKRIHNQILRAGFEIDVAFCPERVLEGKAIKEIYSLPQIVSGCTERSISRAKDLFSVFKQDYVDLDTEEAEVAKLICNTWRYITFAAANEFYMIAESHKLDFCKIKNAIQYNYPRMKDLPNPGFAAGPCLLKDTVQLNNYAETMPHLGSASILINEGLPGFIVNQIERDHSLDELTIGLLGLAFKANSDDSRWSLAHKLRKIINMKAAGILITDPYVKDERIIPAEELILKSNIIILCTPHDIYRNLDFKGKHVIDVWGFYKENQQIS